MKKYVYAIAENCIVIPNPGDVNADGLENDPEPVVCIPLGVFEDEAKAIKRCKMANRDRDGEDFVVVRLEVRE